MEILTLLIPVSLGLGALGLGAFLWSLRHRQYDDPRGDAERILSPDWEDHPRPDRAGRDHPRPDHPRPD